MEKLRVFEAFAGYGSQSMALKRLGIDFEVVGISEIDKYAIQAYMAVHGETPNYGDISKIDWKEVPDFDFLTYSFPCTDISSAGLQKGLEEGSGTRSSLLWECKKAIEAKRPKYLLMENVKALTFKKFKPYLEKWLDYLKDLGYTNFAKVLNAKNYGVPQNRERIFVVSVLGEAEYSFPEGFELDKRLKDVLEKDVDESFYLSKKMTDYLVRTDERMKGSNNGHRFTAKTEEDIAFTIRTAPGSRIDDNFIKEPVNPITCAMRGRNPDNPSDRNPGIELEQRLELGGDIANCITTVQKDSLVAEPKLAIRQATKKGYIEIPQGGVFDASYPDSTTRRGRVQGDGFISPTLTAGGEPPCLFEGIAEPNVLTPNRTEYGKAMRKDYEAGNIQESRHNMTQLEPRTDGVSNTITTVQKDNLLAEPKCLAVMQATDYIKKLRRGNGIITVESDGTIRGNYKHKNGYSSISEMVIMNDENPSLTITTAHTPKCYGETTEYRIRKLTPRECFRLMGVSESDIDKIQSAGISKTQQYKMAGNSIVVDVLYYIFRNLFNDNTN